MTDFSRIIASAPINGTAARQTARGQGFQPAVEIKDYYADMPPLKRPDPDKLRLPDFIDFTGQEFGRLKVLGVMAGKNSKRPASWVCRCRCGGYCSRSTKSLKVALRGGNSFVPMCGQCDYTRRLAEGRPPESIEPMAWKSAWRAPRWKGSAP